MKIFLKLLLLTVIFSLYQCKPDASTKKQSEETDIQNQKDSTKKKLIYQIPFKDVELIANLLQDLEQYYGDKCRIDIEMNDLEDAYINIAKEEEKILLKQR